MLLHSLVLRLQLPVHGHGEAEQAARVAAPLHDAVFVQVEGGGEGPTSQQKHCGDPGDPGIHRGFKKN